MEKLIPVELFQVVQARIQRNGRTPRHTNNAVDFPLTGVIYCEHCGWPLTGYYAKGYKGKLHPYYRCHNKACEYNKRSVQRALVEDAFLERLHAAQADDAVLDLFVEVLNRVCKTKERDNDAIRQKMRADIATLETRISSIGGLVADAATKGDGALVDLYQGQLLAMTAQKGELESRLEAMPPLSASEKFRTAIERGRTFFKNPGILWKNGSVPQKKRLVRMLFTEKPRWTAENGFRTARMPRIFNKNTVQMDGKSFLAAPTGFEPVFSP
ncbi:MAG: zinc ribbon domain-containing protein [Alphaproteobacteria bacterium]|nr:zinc ribbon domain-containing protein [Alphaproteobacteria bacterium]